MSAVNTSSYVRESNAGVRPPFQGGFNREQTQG
jgi:hypothetical protein